MTIWFWESIFQTKRKKVPAMLKEALKRIDWNAVPTTLQVLGDDPDNVITEYVKDITQRF